MRWGVRVRDGEADLGHAVALEQHVPGELPPLREQPLWEPRRAAHHQPQRGARLPHALWSGSFIAQDAWGEEAQLLVDGGDCHEEREPGQRGREEAGPYARRGVAEELAGGVGVQGGADDGHEALDVVQGEHGEDAVAGAPLPRLVQRQELRGQVAVRAHDPFGRAGGA